VSLPPCRPFKSVLVANRGEIALRIVREAKRAGLRAIAVYSDADRNAAHVSNADDAVHIGPSLPAASYLSVAALLAAAKKSNAEAIHPGYGFLAENADFAQSVIDAGLVWIGPSPDAIRAMGDKGNAKILARKAGVPVIPGYDGDDQSEKRLAEEAARIEWPVLIKAALGGGGRGQRRVEELAAFSTALESARRESKAAFASDRVILERALDKVRHVEVQVFGDSHHNIVHLGERDCSVQRRNQKILEEAPAPGVSAELRARMGDAAVRLARAVSYVNAGTVEFLLDDAKNFYFLEMNTRIQVEHPVTEEVTGLNLIALQFDVAMGKPMPLSQDKVRIAGHAIEARLCAEDPADNFAPQSGHVEELKVGNIARADSIEAAGEPASGHYDSMLVKLIARGDTRDQARQTLVRELQAARVCGIRTNRNFLIDVLNREAFAKGGVDIRWLEREPAYAEQNLNNPIGDIAALYLAMGEGKPWRSTGIARSIVVLRDRKQHKRFVVENGRIGVLSIVSATGADRTHLQIENDDRLEEAWAYRRDSSVHIHHSGLDAIFEDITYAPAEPKDGSGANVIRAPMAGRIVKVTAEPGATVVKGELLVILEAMKMEHELRAATDGVVDTVTAKQGDQVSIRQTLVSWKTA
jgi:geranyl-CoA carboxylase alpha subunit